MPFTSNDFRPWTLIVRRSGGSRHDDVHKTEILPVVAIIRALHLPNR